MKFMNKLQKKRKELKKDNNGFSLVELIIVIAIMAILVGIVGTQVIPYINKSKLSKDQQVLNSISTAAVTAYSENAESVTGGAITIDNVLDTHSGPAIEDILSKSIQTASGYKDITAFKNSLVSSEKDKVSAVKVEYSPANHVVTTQAIYPDSVEKKNKIKNVTSTL